MSGDIPATRGGRLYIALDTSGSMDVNNRLQTAREGAVKFLQDLRNSNSGLEAIRFVRFAGSVTPVEVSRAGGLIASDFDTIIAYAQTLTVAAGGTNYELAVSSAPAFFAGVPTDENCDNDLFMIFLSDGENSEGSLANAAATVAGIDGLQVFTFNVDGGGTASLAALDNTAIDSIPTVLGGDTEAVTNGFNQAFSVWPQFEGLDVVGDCSDSAGLAGGIDRPAAYIGSELGAVKVLNVRDVTERRHSLRLTQTSLRQLWQRKRWLSEVRGRLNEFWLRGAAQDLLVRQTAAAGAFDVVVDQVRLTAAELVGQPVYIAGSGQRIAAAIDQGSTYRLSFGTPFARAVPVGAPLSILRRVRFDSDSVTISHTLNRSSTTTIPCVEVIS